MIWSILSVLVCVSLVIKLIFFTDEQRRQAGLFYRIVIYMSAVYAFNHVITFLYEPHRVSPWVTILHLALFIGAFLIKPHHTVHHINRGRRITDRFPNNHEQRQR